MRFNDWLQTYTTFIRRKPVLHVVDVEIHFMQHASYKHSHEPIF